MITGTSLSSERQSRSVTNLELPRVAIMICVLVLLSLGILLNLSGLDLVLSRMVADGQNGFPLRGDWLAERLLHYYGGKLTILIALIVILFNIKQIIAPSANKKIIVAGRYVFWSWLISYAIVGALKQFTTLPCPWNLSEFGGDANYVSILETFSSSLPAGHCFPAGHAMGGYGLIGFLFVTLVFKRPMKYALIPVLALGVLYSGAQFFRGAHFLSHDMFSIAISLSVAWGFAEFYLLPSIDRLSYDGFRSQREFGNASVGGSVT